MKRDPVDIVLIYPQLGSFDNIVCDIPLSLIYAAVDSVKSGFAVKILDLRVDLDDWKSKLNQYIEDDASLIGISVMTGNPIKTSLEISKYIKSQYSVPIVWGGAHPTILPEETLKNQYIDYVIRDFGSKSLCDLISHLKHGDIKKTDIIGLAYKEDGRVQMNPPLCAFEMPDFRDLPYQLVDMNSDKYNRLSNGEFLIPIFTAFGCPYKCSFCMSPAVYKKIKGKKWAPYDLEEVFQHIDSLMDKYCFKRLQIYDDDSFVDLDRLHKFLSGYIERGFHEKLVLDFRGARINELDKMDDDFYALMVKANVELLAIGAESGSPATLKKMNKGITVEQTIRVNQKFAKHPTLKPHYNFFCGVPGETYEDLLKTKELILILVRDNPHCYIGVGADWKPLPGSEMTELAVEEFNLNLPSSLEEWALIDSFDAIKLVHPWYTTRMNNMIMLLQLSGMFLDKRFKDYRKDFGFVLGNTVYLLSLLYKPILRLRLRFNFASLLLEYKAMRFSIQTIGKFMK